MQKKKNILKGDNNMAKLSPMDYFAYQKKSFLYMLFQQRSTDVFNMIIIV